MPVCRDAQVECHRAAGVGIVHALSVIVDAGEDARRAVRVGLNARVASAACECFLNAGRGRCVCLQADRRQGGYGSQALKCGEPGI